MKTIYLPLLLSLLGCAHTPSDLEKEQWKNEILAQEKAFEAMVQEKGIPKAFLSFAANDAVLSRNNVLIVGKKEMEHYFEGQDGNTDQATLTWSPDFVEVSNQGDLGYTYGTYAYTLTDSLGNPRQATGVFHTVWKRQPDGSWKFVWD